MSVYPYLPFILVGSLTRDFIITPGGTALNDVQGGHLFYTAAGLQHWEKQIGLVSRIGRDYPEEWIEKLQRFGMDTRGIKRTALPIDQRFFISFVENGEKTNQQPLAHYAKNDLLLPKQLLGYTLPVQREDSRTERTAQTIIAREIPPDYTDSRCIHFCPMDFLTHNLITQHFAQFGQKMITIEAGEGYMVPTFRKVLPTLVKGLSAFITSEAKLRSLFFDRKDMGLWEMAEEIAGWGVENVVIQPENFENLLLDSIHKRKYQLRPYLSKVINRIGINASFCGGFIAGLANTYDPTLALVYGNVASSFVAEGNYPYYSMDVMQGLTKARVDSLKNYVKAI